MAHRYLAGLDGPDHGALPAGEFLQPAPLLALLLLLVNDWYLKSSPWAAGFLTGKLSDVAGLFFFPLLLTAWLDLGLWGLFGLGLDVDFTLRRSKLVGAVTLTGALFCAVKLSPEAGGHLEEVLGWAGIRSRIVTDPSDLLALPALMLAYAVGCREIAQMPLGRLAYAQRQFQRRGVPVRHCVEDLVACGGDLAAVAELASAHEDWLRTGRTDEKERLRLALHNVRGGAHRSRESRRLGVKEETV